ncbi:hydrolase-like protein family [Carex rostrata]
MSNPTQGSATTSGGFSSGEKRPDHLLVLVHGILASPNDWIYAEAELKRRLGSNFLIYVSSANSFIKTFEGIDVAGRRLAAEVENVVEENYGLTKISFLAHSLGGLFTRYAIAVMYSSDDLTMGVNITSQNTKTDDSKEVTSRSGLIVGLEPINFITLATPHLGVRGNKQLPFLLGLEMLEKLAPPLAPLLVGQTGRQLFLTDGKPSKRPLLLRMASDSEDNEYISALAAFKNRTVYANVSYDHMVGWRTSSIRRETELKPSTQCLDGYKHVVGVEHCPAVSSDGPQFPSEAAVAKKAAQEAPTPQNTDQYHHIMEEEVIRGLQRVSWKKVDVSFHAALWPFLAHNNIHVKTEWLHNAGASVISHVADSIKQHEYHTCIFAHL